MSFKAVIFDLDGTLIYIPENYRRLVVGETVSALKGKLSLKDADRFWFETNKDEIIIQSFGLVPKKFWKEFRKQDKPSYRSRHVSLYWDLNFILELRSRRIKTAILTETPKPIRSLELSLIERKVDQELFDAIVTAKPSCKSVEKCLELMDTDKDKTLYVGNSREYIEAAKSAGVYDVLINRGEYEFQNLNPSLTIKSLPALREQFGIKKG